jgi:cullin-associated NEDD8-dissociated protein 1
LVCYDPNYIYQDDGDDEKMEEDDGGWGDNSDFSEEQDVQDDDDTSWKVRRGGCRVIQSIILTRPELHGYIIADYTLKLADRFKERSDDVKIELLDAFRLLV